MTQRYAVGTKVPMDQSRREIEMLVSKNGASEFVFSQRQTGATVAFQLNDRVIRFDLSYPPDGDFAVSD